MKKETEEEWLERMLDRSEALNRLIETESRDDPAGWGKLCQTMWERSADERPMGLWLVGPEGCGKHDTAYEMTQILLKRSGIPFAVFYLTGADLTEDASGAAEVREHIDTLMMYCHELDDASLCLVLEQMEDCRFRREILDYLATVMCMTKVDGNPMFLILIEEEPLFIPALLRRQLRLMRLTLPNEAQRRDYLTMHTMDIRNRFDMEEMCAVTEGLSYAQLADLIECIRELGPTSRDAVLSLAESQRPEPQQADLRERLLELLENLPEVLTEAIASIPVSAPVVQIAGQPVAAQAAEPEASNQQEMTKAQKDAFLASEKKRFEEMQPAELASDLFGEPLKLGINA